MKVPHPTDAELDAAISLVQERHRDSDLRAARAALATVTADRDRLAAELTEARAGADDSTGGDGAEEFARSLLRRIVSTDRPDIRTARIMRAVSMFVMGATSAANRRAARVVIDRDRELVALRREAANVATTSVRLLRERDEAIRELAAEIGRHTAAPVSVANGPATTIWLAHLESCSDCNLDREFCGCCEVGVADGEVDTEDKHMCNCEHGKGQRLRKAAAEEEKFWPRTIPFDQSHFYSRPEDAISAEQIEASSCLICGIKFRKHRLREPGTAVAN